MSLKKYKVKQKFKEDIEPEEVLLDSKRLKESSDAETEKMEKPIKQSVLKMFFAFIIIILVILLFNSFLLQVIRGDYWRNLADENRVRSYPVKALRGIIYDKNMVPLAINIPKLDLVVVPADLAKLDGFDDLKEKVKDNIHLSYPVVVEQDLSLERALLLESQYADVSAVKVLKTSQRQYESGFAHVLGYLGKVNEEEVLKGYLLDDFIGRTGLENVYEKLLKGIDGEELVEIDNLGVTQKVLAFKDSIPGNDLVLSIDAGLQKKLYQSLRAKLNTLSTSKAAGIALDPRNGKILAMVSFPNFDANTLSEDYDKIINNVNLPLFNRAVSGEYPSGSVIKPLIAAAGLKEGIDPNEQLNCPGFLSVPDVYNPGVYWTFNDWKEHGIVSMVKAIAESCNVYFYNLGEKLGVDVITKYLRLFGWGKELGVKFPGEASGFIPSREWKEDRGERWYVGDTYNISIGQGDITATPLQIAASIGAISNGKLYQPQFLEKTKPKLIRNIGDFDIVRKGMREAVISGSAKSLYELPVKVAGKTGTAQSSGVPHGWMVAYAPYEDPQIVIVVLVENGGGGSTSATPVVKDVLNYYLTRDF